MNNIVLVFESDDISYIVPGKEIAQIKSFKREDGYALKIHTEKDTYVALSGISKDAAAGFIERLARALAGEEKVFHFRTTE